MQNNKLIVIMPYFLMIPSIIIGILAMISYGVDSSIWIQNIIVWIFGTILGCAFLIRNKKSYLHQDNFSLTIIILLLLVLPFLFDGLDGVHRWVSLGPIRFNVAVIFLPLLIIQLWRLSLKRPIFYTVGLTYIALITLLLHPDASQVTAFACATVVMIWKNITTPMLKILHLALTAIIVILSWLFLDDLAPVPFVEQIIFLVADMGTIWLILGVISLILLLLPFFLGGKKNVLSLSLGAYYLMMIIATFFGNFPMPIMGYGVSPIIGYSIAITLLNKVNR
ncbi:hypothetical protein RCG19_14745 [Neobacillus sp. OS1-2]|uniref:hypothetical protein n=1 Tax=Neobacillus sp. OS1-2 TaxID=3070680 RepID=UPI0027E17D6C|nr:hypothetical protein [Neobacillus sp. OS1-2]WML38474.1 hypothetical protein RCG19_14745 [Neobacillus sp. OS1-2]